MNNLAYLVPFLMVGLIAGTGAGLLGIGGGIIYIPSLLFLLPMIGVPKDQIVLVAITTSLFTAMFSSGSAFYNHYKLNNVEVKKALLFVIGTIVTSTIVPRFAVKMNPFIPKFSLLLVLIVAFAKIFLTKEKNIKSKYLLNDYYLVLFGLFVGTLSAVSGIGGGLVVVPLLTTYFWLDFKYAIGTSTMVVFVTIFSSSLSYWIASSSSHGAFGFINVFAAVPMVAGALIGSIYGTKIGRKFSTSTIKGIFSVVLLIAIIKIFIEL